jgi:hypothetical protein
MCVLAITVAVASALLLLLLLLLLLRLRSPSTSNASTSRKYPSVEHVPAGRGSDAIGLYAFTHHGHIFSGGGVGVKNACTTASNKNKMGLPFVADYADPQCADVYGVADAFVDAHATELAEHVRVIAAATTRGCAPRGRAAPRAIQHV